MQDFKDATKQIAYVDQGGLGLPERDYYFRTGDKDKQIREQYVAHITNMLSLSGETPQQALVDAKNILAFETKLADVSLTNTQRRDPAAIYHMEKLADFEASISPMPFDKFLETIHTPHIDSLNVTVPKFFPAAMAAVTAADIQTLRAYLRYQLLSRYASQLSKQLDLENFDFYARKLYGQPEQRARWKRCSTASMRQLG